jgi:hypothetical protein
VKARALPMAEARRRAEEAIFMVMAVLVVSVIEFRGLTSIYENTLLPSSLDQHASAFSRITSAPFMR